MFNDVISNTWVDLTFFTSMHLHCYVISQLRSADMQKV